MDQELTLLASQCGDIDECPRIFRLGSRQAAVVGDEVTDPAVLAKVHLGPGEKLVAIPLAMLIEAGGNAGQAQ
jgi:hypothetical protein